MLSPLLLHLSLSPSLSSPPFAQDHSPRLVSLVDLVLFFYFSLSIKKVSPFQISLTKMPRFATSELSLGYPQNVPG
jgi:hypothetical protein